MQSLTNFLFPIKLTTTRYRIYATIHKKTALNFVEDKRKVYWPICSVRTKRSTHSMDMKSTGSSIFKRDWWPKKGQPISKKSRQKTLHPILDAFDVLRVGGRMQNAFVSYDEKYPDPFNALWSFRWEHHYDSVIGYLGIAA